MDDTPHQPAHSFVRVISNINSPFFTNGMPSIPLLADDVVASVRRMYADDYSLVKRLAGLGLDDLLANATTA